MNAQDNYAMRDWPDASLSDLLGRTSEMAAEADWLAEDLGAMLRHQMRSRLIDDIPALVAGDEQSGVDSWHTATFGDLLSHPAPPRVLLEAVRAFAKPGTVTLARLPEPVATAVYFAAILKAFLASGEWITQLDRATVHHAARWMGEQAWICEPLRSLAADAVKRFEQ